MPGEYKNSAHLTMKVVINFFSEELTNEFQCRYIITYLIPTRKHEQTTAVYSKLDFS